MNKKGIEFTWQKLVAILLIILGLIIILVFYAKIGDRIREMLGL